MCTKKCRNNIDWKYFINNFYCMKKFDFIFKI